MISKIIKPNAEVEFQILETDERWQFFILSYEYNYRKLKDLAY